MRQSINEEIECAVTIIFSDNDKMYTLKRSMIARKVEDGKVLYGEPEVHLDYKIKWKFMKQFLIQLMKSTEFFLKI